MHNNIPDVLIIGTGMTGLCLGNLLFEKGLKVELIEKSKGLGGRMATRRFAGQAYDTGAQFIRARSQGFRNFLQPYIESEALREWKKDKESNPLYWGNPQITTFPKAMAEYLNIHLEQHATSIEYVDSHWECETKSGLIHSAKNLIITSPVPQTLDLFKNSNLMIDVDELNKLQAIQYRKTLGMLALAENPSHLEPWLETPDIPYLDRYANQSVKTGNGLTEAMLFHFNHDFSVDYYDKEQLVTLKAMIKVLAPKGFEFKEVQLKRWRYADPITTYGELFLKVSPLQNLYLAGDAFGGGSVEGAWRSANALAQSFNAP